MLCFIEGVQIMRHRFRAFALALAFFGLLGGAGIANAAAIKTIIEVQVDGGPWQTVASSMNPDDDLNANVFLSKTGLSTKQQADSIFRLAGGVTSSWPGDSFQTYVASSTSSVFNLTTGVHTINIASSVADCKTTSTS